MADQIKFLSLQKEELKYEVALRGGTPGDSVSELRKQIVKLSQGQASEDILESHLEPSDDLKGVKESLLKSQSNLQTLKAKYDKNLYSRTDNLLNHISYRLCRITPISEENTDILKQLTQYHQSQYIDLTNLSSQLNSNLTSVSDTVADPPSSSILVNCNQNFSSEITKLKYDGKTCVRSFIQRVDEFVEARSINSNKIISFATEIFVDDALHWYRSIKSSITSWNELTFLLKKDFGQFDYDYRFLSEIRARTQGENENITVYLAIMQGMFSRLSKVMSEEDKLEIILHNIRPCYATVLATSPEIKTINNLLSLCLNYEHFQSRLLQFKEPPRITSDTLAPEFAYKYPNTNYSKAISTNKNYNVYNNTDSINVSNVAPIEVNPSRTFRYYNKYCPRCRTNDHSLKQCKLPKDPVCFKCGKKDVIYTNCPDCKKRLTTTDTNTATVTTDDNSKN